MNYKNLAIAAALGAITIILGAFGAHALKKVLSEDMLASFETGVKYQMYHVFVLLFVNSFASFTLKDQNMLTAIFVIGILLFSGSIYLITALKVSPKNIWFITPLGGTILIVGWIMMVVKFLKLA